MKIFLIMILLSLNLLSADFKNFSECIYQNRVEWGAIFVFTTALIGALLKIIFNLLKDNGELHYFKNIYDEKDKLDIILKRIEGISK